MLSPWIAARSMLLADLTWIDPTASRAKGPFGTWHIIERGSRGMTRSAGVFPARHAWFILQCVRFFRLLGNRIGPRSLRVVRDGHLASLEPLTQTRQSGRTSPSRHAVDSILPAILSNERNDRIHDTFNLIIRHR